MAQKNIPRFSIREFRPSDQHVVMSLLHDGILEHVYPAFFRAMSHPDHVGIALSVSVAGYVLGGSSYFQALLFGGAWAGLVYYCCREIYGSYLTRRLSSDMADIRAHYVEKPDSGFWVAEADVNGKCKVVGMVAVIGKRGEEGGDRCDDWNGRVTQGGSEFVQNEGRGSYGEISHMAVNLSWRRQSLGSQLTQKASEFCKERGYGRLVVDVSSPQTAALALYRKLGFVQSASHNNTHANRWFSKLAEIKVKRMEKFI